MENDKKMLDLIIIGAGPAGLGASIYASRYKLDHIVIGNEIGGQVVEASEIENWAGEVSIPGKELMDKFVSHVKHFGANIIQSDVSSVAKTENGFDVMVGGEKYQTKSLILALGMKPRKMNAAGEDKFIGKGVSYCATCDAMFYRDKDVIVIGGGDAAATAAIHLTEFANKIYLAYRDEYNWEPSWDEQIEKSGKIEKIKMQNVKEIKGGEKVSGIALDVDGVEKELPVQGVFIEVGTTPGVAIAQGLEVELDEQSYIKVDQAQATNIENIYAAGDVTTGSNKFRQIITAVAEGAVASGSVYRKLKLKK